MDENKKEIEAAPEVPVTEENRQMKFVYKRSQFYREILVDGMFGNLTPNFDIHVSLYNQHYGELKEQLFNLNPDGTLGAEIKSNEDGPQEVYREIEAGFTLNVGTAISFIRWLTNQVRAAQKAMGEEALEESDNGK